MQLVSYEDKKHYLATLKLSSKSFKCKVAAIVLDATDTLVSEGVNCGLQSHMEETSCCNAPVYKYPKSTCHKCGKTNYRLLSVNVVHAEISALLDISKDIDISTCTMYMTRFPCAKCRARLKKANLKWEVLTC